MRPGATRVRPGHSTGQAKAEGAAGKVSFTISVEESVGQQYHFSGTLPADQKFHSAVAASLQCGPLLAACDMMSRGQTWRVGGCSRDGNSDEGRKAWTGERESGGEREGCHHVHRQPHTDSEH